MSAQSSLSPQTELTGSFLDRRSRPRLRLSYLLRLRRPDESTAIETRTEDLSCEGFYFISDQPLVPHEKLECELLIPAHGSASDAELVLRGLAEVVRVVPVGVGPKCGVACHLEDYIFAS